MLDIADKFSAANLSATTPFKKYITFNKRGCHLTMKSRRSAMWEIIVRMHELSKNLTINSPYEYENTKSLVKEYKTFIYLHQTKKRTCTRKVSYLCFKRLCCCNQRVEITIKNLTRKLDLYIKNILDTKNAKFHGTAFCTLFVMSKLSGSDKHSLIPLGELMKKGIPCFVGELGRGMNGVNRRGTSWTSSAHVAKSYATALFQWGDGGERYTVENSRHSLNALINEYIFFKNKTYHFFMYSRDALYWQRYLLAVRRLRHLDDEEFQKKFKDGLTNWVNQVIEDEEKILSSSSAFPLRKTEAQQVIDYGNRFIVELNKKIDALGKNAQDRESLLDTTPIVLVAKNITEKEVYQKGDHEYVVERFMQLGRDIDCILTSDPHIPRVRKHLIDNGLADKVNVFSLSVLS